MSRRRWAALVVASVLVVLFGGRWVAVRYTEHAWFADAGLGPTWWRGLLRGLGWQAATFLVATLWYAAQTLAVSRSIGAVHLPRRVGNLEIAEAVPRTWLRWLALGIAVLLGVATTYSFSDLDHYAALYRHAVPLGVVEPVLGKDAAFYLARLPLLEMLQLLSLLSVVLALLLAGGLYALTGSLTFSQRRLRISPHARIHLTLLLTALALALAWGFQLDAYELVGGGGDRHGALSGVDRAFRLPASNALALIALVLAVGTGMGVRVVRPPVLLGLWATLLVSTLLGRGLVPFLAEALGSSQGPAVDRALESYASGWSRAGLGLLQLVAVPTNSASEPSPDSLGRLGDELSGLAPWSLEPGLLEAALAAGSGDTSSATTWSSSLSVFADADGAPRIVALAVAQADPLRLARSGAALSWTARHRGTLAWGGPVVAALASARSGTPQYFGRLEPADTPEVQWRTLALAGGRVRFLPGPSDLAIVGPDEGAIGEPPPGLLLGGRFRRLLLAWALQSPPLMGKRTSAADRVLFWRDVPGRLAKLYPFASFEPPRAALVERRLVWVAAGFLASPRFPLAEHLGWRGEDVNYLSSPYIATVDASSGTTRLYLRNQAPAFAVSVARSEGIEPLPSDSLPPALATQMVYPPSLLAAQAMTAARHASDSVPRWALAARDSSPTLGVDAGLVRPATVLLELGDLVPRQWSLLPLTDAAGNRLAAVVTGAADARGRLILRILQLPETGFPTPAAVASRLATTPAALALAATSGPIGAVRRSHVVPVPVAGTVVYAQAVFVAREDGAPAMDVRAVAVATATRAGIGSDFGEAVRSLVRGDDAGGGGDGTFAAGSSLAQARAAFLRLDSAMRAADWVRVGRAYAALRQALGLAPEERP